jgi:DNA-binding PadR family transcriptional regulator
MKFQSPTLQQISILKFLRVETCSTPEVIQSLLNQKSVQASYQILNRMVALKFLTKTTIPVVSGRAVLLYGITNHGLAYAWDLDETPLHRPTFQPSKISVFTLQHRLDIQKIHVFAEQAGWTNWRDGSQLGFRQREQKVPDAVAVSTANEMVAFEIEREIKSMKRYRTIVLSHLLNRKNGHWDSIIYLCPTSDLALRLKRVFENLGAIDFNAKKITLTEAHLKPFKFMGYNDFIDYLQINE